MWASLIERKHLMSNHPHQRKLRRSIGSQPVGSVVGPRQPEVGIAGQVIPSQSPRRTFRSSDDRDLANLANLVAGDHGGPTRALISGLYLGLSSAFRKNVEELASRRASTTRQALPSPSNCPNVSSGVIARHHPVGVKPPPFPLEIARNHF